MNTIKMMKDGRPATREEIYSFAGIPMPRYSEKHKAQVTAKLSAHCVDIMDKGATDECLSNCVCADFCIGCADEIRKEKVKR
jgi:hypothetical protein